MIRLLALFSLCLAFAACGDDSAPYFEDSAGPGETGGEDPGGNTGDDPTGGDGDGDGDDPGDDTGDGDTDDDDTGDGDTGDGDTGDDDPTMPPTCRTTPVRYIVLGDSINACSTIGGKQDPRCSPKIHHEFLVGEYAPEAVYENYAIGGAVTETVVTRQLGQIPTGQPGHALVNILIGGNDMQPYIFASDQAARERFEVDKPRILALWDQIFEFFENPANFPDGVTMIMNTQYNPFDDCTAPPFNLSALKIDLLNRFNVEYTRLAGERDYAVITDQHASYLGHGHHFDVDTCPHYDPDFEGWMGDLIHPNRMGHANLALEWEKTSNGLYGTCD